MAQTKTRPKKAKPKTSAASKPKSRRSGSKPKSRASKPAASKPQEALHAVEETAKDAGGKVGAAAGRAKVPLIAGGAAIAGAVGGAALGMRQAHRHRHHGIAGVDSDDLAKAARKVGDLGVQVGELAFEARRARREANGKVHRSPVEVVLDGLTARRSR